MNIFETIIIIINLNLQIIFLMLGQKIGFFRGDIQGLFDDIQKLRPTHFVAVPRILNKIFNKVKFF